MDSQTIQCPVTCNEEAVRQHVLKTDQQLDLHPATSTAGFSSVAASTK
jgi:hypothetical protein